MDAIGRMKSHPGAVLIEQVTIPKETAQILFDALTQSMDFGSGFLDTGEVEALRALAAAIGVDPAEATPQEFRGQYPHPFDGGDGYGHCGVGPYGRKCAKPESDPIHGGAE